MASSTDDIQPPTDAAPPGVEGDARAPDSNADDELRWVEGVRLDRPVLYASRHLIKPVVTLLLAVLGVDALLRTLLPRFDINVEWLRAWLEERRSWVPDPLGWVARRVRDVFGDLQVAEWVGGVLRTAKWWVPILAALVVAAHEVNLRWTGSGTGERASTDDDVVDGADGQGAS